MDGLGVGDIRTEARGAWLFDRIVTTGSVVLSAVGGSEAWDMASSGVGRAPRGCAGVGTLHPGDRCVGGTAAGRSPVVSSTFSPVTARHRA